MANKLNSTDLEQIPMQRIHIEGVAGSRVNDIKNHYTLYVSCFSPKHIKGVCEGVDVPVWMAHSLVPVDQSAIYI